MMKFDKEFKEAIISLPESEKDKLLLRLLKKDLNLVNKLSFELLSDETVDDKRVKMENRIVESVKEATENFYSLGYLMMDLRSLSGYITEHVKITKDKFGEVSLNLLMVNEALKHNFQHIDMAKPAKSHKLCIYIVARLFKILVLIKSLHEDYWLELEEAMQELESYLNKSERLINTAIDNGLDLNWLQIDNIPDNISKIHQEIRAQGFLK